MQIQSIQIRILFLGFTEGGVWLLQEQEWGEQWYLALWLAAFAR